VEAIRAFRSPRPWIGLAIVFFLVSIAAAYAGTTIHDPGLRCVNDSSARVSAWRVAWHRSGSYMDAAGWLALGVVIAPTIGIVMAKRRGLLVLAALAGLVFWVVFQFYIIDQILHKPPCAGF
jgi:hypothetical protein